MTGSISRQAAIEALENERLFEVTDDSDGAYERAITDCIEALSALPAVGDERENLTNWATGVLQNFIRNLENEVYYIEDFPKDVIDKLRDAFMPLPAPSVVEKQQ